LEEFEWWTKPREKSLFNELKYMFLEIVFLKGVWEHNRRLWWFSFPLHMGLYVSITAAGLVILAAILGAAGVPVSGWTAARAVVVTLAGVGYGLGAIGSAGLLASRLADPRLKATTAPVSLINLALLLTLFATGVWALVSTEYFTRSVGLVRALLTADFSVRAPVSLALHLTVVGLFLAYLPFSQMMHFVAKYFTYHQVRWDDQPLTAGSRLEREVTALVKQPVTWSAPHLKADGKKNWVDIATEETEK
jgi:nitrate reductase gamma subunit